MIELDIAAIALGISIGAVMVLLYGWYLYWQLRNRIDRMVGRVMTEIEADLVGLDVELENGVFFCYNNKDKQFVCQGNSVADIKQAFQARFPDKTAYLAGGDHEAVRMLRAEIENNESGI